MPSLCAKEAQPQLLLGQVQHVDGLARRGVLVQPFQLRAELLAHLVVVPPAEPRVFQRLCVASPQLGRLEVQPANLLVVLAVLQYAQRLVGLVAQVAHLLAGDGPERLRAGAYTVRASRA